MSRITQCGRGFTLIELSVVIILIGLIIASVVSAASLINKSKIRLIGTESQSIYRAYVNFVDAYGVKPGDTTKGNSLFPSTANGNGNGLIDFGETGNAFLQMSLAGFMPEKYNNAGCCGESSFPQSAAKTTRGGGINRYNFANATGTYANSFPEMQNRSLLILREYDSTVAGDWTITPKNAFYVDQKFDDGTPNAGKIMGAGDWITRCAKKKTGDPYGGHIVGPDYPGTWKLEYDVGSTTSAMGDTYLNCQILGFLGY